MLLSPVWMLIPFDRRATKFGILSRHGERNVFLGYPLLGRRNYNIAIAVRFLRSIEQWFAMRSATCSFATVEISAKHASVFGAVIELGTAYRGC